MARAAIARTIRLASCAAIGIFSFTGLPAAAGTMSPSAQTILSGDSFPGAEPGERRAAMQVAQRERRRSRRSRARRSRSSGGASSAFAGRYAILRKDNRDSNCLLNINRGGRAQLGPRCGDHGMRIFDPVRWAVSGNRMTLRARKGHRITFVRKEDGIWYRDPANSKRPLALRKY